MAFEAHVADGVLQVRRAGTRWLSTGVDGGFARGDGAYNVTVPEGWPRTDVGAYARRRRKRAGFEARGPALLTGVDMEHARGARLGPAVAFATVGLSNPAALPVAPAEPTAETRAGTDTGTDTRAGTDTRTDTRAGTSAEPRTAADPTTDDPPPDTGTVNLVVGTTRALPDAALANLVAVAAEAKAATLLSLSGFPGTTTDAVVVGSADDGERAAFSGSATAVGSAARACVRDAVRASLRSRYADRALPDTVEGADHGVVTDRRAEVFEIEP